MDLSSSGVVILLTIVLTLCIIVSGQGYIDNEETERSKEWEDDSLQLPKEVFIIEKINSENRHNVKQLLQTSLELHEQITVKLTGNPVGIVYDMEDIEDILWSDNDRTTNEYNEVAEIADVLQLGDQRLHVCIVLDGGYGMTGDDGELFNQLRDRNVKVDIIRLHTEATRYRRQINFYQLLANISGGSVIQTDKNNIGSALDLLKQSIKNSLVHIMRFTDHSSPGKEFRIPADDTMTQLIFKAQVERSNPVIFPTSPAGIPPSSHPRLLGKASAGTVVGLFEVNLTQPTDYGTWKISKMDSNLWDVSVDAESPIDFTHAFLEPGPGGYGEYPIKGRPIAGLSYKTSITVPEYAKVQSVSMAMLFTRSNMQPFDMKGLTNVGGRRGKSMFHANFTMPKENFMIGIEGRDNSGHSFRRLDPIMISPISLRLFVPSFAGVKFYQNDTLRISFTVVNEAQKEQDVDVKIEDDKKFALAPIFLSATIKPGENYTNHFTIQAGNVPGVTTTVTITAKPYVKGGLFSSGQYELRRFTVLEKNHTTTTSTTTTTTTTTTTPTPTTSSTTATTAVSSTTSQSSTVSASPGSSVTSSVTSAATSSAGKGSSNTNTPSISSVSNSASTPKSGSTVKPSITGTSPVKTTPIAGSNTNPGASTTQSSSTKAPGKPASTVNGQTAGASTKPVPSSTSSMASGAAGKTVSTTTQAAPQSNNESNNNNNNDMATASLAAGVTVGAAIGLAAIGAMAYVFGKAFGKSRERVDYYRDNNSDRRRSSSGSTLAWT